MTNYPRRPKFRSKGQQANQDIAGITSRRSEVRRFYDMEGCEPPISEMQGWSGMMMAGHIAREVAERAPEGSKPYEIAQGFIGEYAARLQEATI